jgi:hypothetical protein
MFDRTAPPPPKPREDTVRNVGISLDEHRVHFGDAATSAQFSRRGGRLEARKKSASELNNGTPSSASPRSGR